MPRSVRMLQPAEIYFVTARCFQRRFLLRPSNETNEVFGGVLARSLRLHEVELFAFHVMSNHMHLIVRAPRGNLPRFMQYLMTNISKKIGALVAWRGGFWQRRYSAEPILDNDALLGRVRYVLSHGVKEGLVRSCLDWPGLSSLPLLLDGQTRRFRWFNWTRRASGNVRREKRPLLDPRWAEAEELRLTNLPHPALKRSDSLRRFLRRVVRGIEETAARKFRNVLGRTGVVKQRPHSKAAPVERKAHPACHASVPGTLEAFLERYRAFVEAFRKASARWRNGDHRATFPEWAIKPFIWTRPR